MHTYQLVVIGAGPGGLAAALQAAKYGIRTALIEEREVGGTCLNRGCVPTKALLRASGVFRNVREGAAFGIHVEKSFLDAGAIHAFQEGVIRTLRQGSETRLQRAKIPLLRGRAKITGPHSIRISEPGGQQTEITADSILIATGAVPSRPAIPGLDLPGVLTSDELLACPNPLFHSVVIIGGGVIGSEFAAFYSDLGIPVTVIEGCDRLLPQMDREFGRNLAFIFKQKQVAIKTGSLVQSVERGLEGLTVRCQSEKEEWLVPAEMVLCAVGRSPNWKPLFDGKWMPEQEDGRIRVNKRFETSIPGIYAIGDASSKIQLAHAATAQGETFADLLAGKDSVWNHTLIPNCVYCEPEIASVGITEMEARQDGIPVRIGKCVLGGNARAVIDGSARSFVRIIAEEQTGVILGAQLMCARATEMISQFTTAISCRMTAKQMLAAVRPHPTFEESVGEALRDLNEKLMA